ncbi:MAG: TfoX/Sxy family protein [Rhodospirillales bacterium]
MSPEFRDYLLDMLRPLGAVSARAMFGGGGLYLHGTMFALIFDDTLYLKADAETKGDFEARGMDPFTYEIEGRPGAVEMSYWEAPPDLLDDADELCAWGHRAWQAARRVGAKKSKSAGAKIRRRQAKPKRKHGKRR